MQSTGTSHSPTVLNKQAALFRMGGDHQILKLLSQAFLEDIPGLMQELQLAVTQQDAVQVHHAAHKIKGLAANFDGFATMQLAALLETRGRQADLNGTDLLFSKLQVEVQRLQQAIREEVLTDPA